MTNQTEPAPAAAPEQAALLCAGAWKRAYDLAFLDAERHNCQREKQRQKARALEQQNGENLGEYEDDEDDEDDEEINPEGFARQQARLAFRDAMPPLSGYDNICGFIACVTYALLHEIFYDADCANLFAAAKVALAALRVQPRTPHTRARKTKKISENCTNSSAI